MSNRPFQFRLHSSHTAPERHSQELEVAMLRDGDRWEAQQLHLDVPGFRLYLIALLLCQHRHLVRHGLEKGLPLQRVDAEFEVSTTDDWDLISIRSQFRIQLDAGSANVDASCLGWIQERMARCPVGRNLPPGVDSQINLTAFVE
jgi:hypothetical protein